MFAPAIYLLPEVIRAETLKKDMAEGPVVLMPAYGEHYNSAKEMLADWQQGVDFKMYGCGGYCSVRDIAALMQNTTSITIMQASPLLTVRIV